VSSYDYQGGVALFSKMIVCYWEQETVVVDMVPSSAMIIFFKESNHLWQGMDVSWIKSWYSSVIFPSGCSLHF
jgi:hypothetical protein